MTATVHPFPGAAPPPPPPPPRRPRGRPRGPSSNRRAQQRRARQAYEQRQHDAGYRVLGVHLSLGAADALREIVRELDVPHQGAALALLAAWHGPGLASGARSPEYAPGVAAGGVYLQPKVRGHTREQLRAVAAVAPQGTLSDAVALLLSAHALHPQRRQLALRHRISQLDATVAASAGKAAELEAELASLA